MGDDEGDVAGVVTEEVILREASNRGLTVQEAQDGISWRIASDDGVAFFPKAFSSGAYTEDQLDVIEDAFRECGVDLFPLGRSLH